MRQEDREYIAELYRRRFVSLFAYANTILQSASQAEEAVQEAFRIACSKVDDIRNCENPDGWITLTVKNVCRNMLRKRMTMQNLIVRLATEHCTECDAYYDEENVKILYSNFSGDADFELIKRLALDRKSILEIAQEDGITLAACKKRIQRAKKRLKAKWK